MEVLNIWYKKYMTNKYSGNIYSD